MIHTKLPRSHRMNLSMCLTVTLSRFFRHKGSRRQVPVRRKWQIF